MNFDIKDVKSWSNRHDVKVGDVGYFFDAIRELKDDRFSKHKDKITNISDDCGFSFLTQTSNYCFFLPLDAVKEDKPKEKKYRPFRTRRDFLRSGAVKSDCLIDSVLTLRNKKHYNLTRDMKIIEVEYDFDTVAKINGYSLDCLFTHFDIYINDEWRPFGVEVKE